MKLKKDYGNMTLNQVSDICSEAENCGCGICPFCLANNDDEMVICAITDVMPSRWPFTTDDDKEEA